VGIYLLQGFAGYMMGLIIGVLCKSEQFAVQIVPLILIPMVLFGGLAINLNSIPEYAGWIQYINPIRYGYNALLNSQLKTESL
jgi:ABC-type multidrug transport system permease subunit